MDTATEALDNATKRVLAAGAWISWKFALVFAFAGIAAVATNYAIGRFALPNGADVETARAELAVLKSEKDELETNIANLTKRGGRIKLSACGPTNRLCVRITPKQGPANVQSDFQGSWISGDGQERYVIPLGY